MNDRKNLRCAVYTRKSSEEGLDQAFNSLDAQREACIAYVTSQESLGWRLIPDLYDDGGISGGTLDRPAIQKLLLDIQGGRIDIIVVYKIDRLTRSLMDFARLVDVFDKHNVSFVSVTQQFNTTTSMGRLTLNVLLSFAQFEREVTAERIRDKIAASKKKGMWMGGNVPFGYRVQNRKLLVNETEATQVQRIFTRYLELRSVQKLYLELNAATENTDTNLGAVQQSFARRYTRNQLTYILSNTIYCGKIRHQKQLYDGEHSAIVMQETFNAVQQLLADNAVNIRGARLNANTHLLTGLIYDAHGNRLTPVHATNHGKRYRYYATDTRRADSVNAEKVRIAAAAIEPIAIDQLIHILKDKPKLSEWIEEFRDDINLLTLLEQSDILLARLESDRGGVQRRLIFRAIFERVTVTPSEIRYVVDVPTLLRIVASHQHHGLDQAFIIEVAAFAAKGVQRGDRRDSRRLYEIIQPCMIKRRGIEMRLMVENATASRPDYDLRLISTIAKAHIALEILTNKKRISIAEAAGKVRMNGSDLCRILPLAFLSPKITQAILSGKQPPDLNLRKLTRELDLPITWTELDGLLND